MYEEIEPNKNYTVAEFMRLAHYGKRYDLVEGALIERFDHDSLAHGEIITRLFSELQFFPLQVPIGKVLGNTPFGLGPKTAYLPDLAFVQHARLQGLNRGEAFPGLPDLIIEILSPSDVWSDISVKVQLYQQAGSKLIWVVDPFDLVVNVYQLGQPRRTFLQTDALDGLSVLPGFKMPVQQLFES